MSCRRWEGLEPSIPKGATSQKAKRVPKVALKTSLTDLPISPQMTKFQAGLPLNKSSLFPPVQMRQNMKSQIKTLTASLFKLSGLAIHISFTFSASLLTVRKCLTWVSTVHIVDPDCLDVTSVTQGHFEWSVVSSLFHSHTPRAAPLVRRANDLKVSHWRRHSLCKKCVSVFQSLCNWNNLLTSIREPLTNQIQPMKSYFVPVEPSKLVVTWNVDFPSFWTEEEIKQIRVLEQKTPSPFI